MALDSLHFGTLPEKFDYTEYEEKLRQITSVKLMQITDLSESSSMDFERNCVAVGKEYLKQVEELLAHIERDENL